MRGTIAESPEFFDLASATDPFDPPYSHGVFVGLERLPHFTVWHAAFAATGTVKFGMGSRV